MKRLFPLMLALAVSACGSEFNNSPAAAPAPAAQAPAISEPASVAQAAVTDETAGTVDPDTATADADAATEAETPAPEVPAAPVAPTPAALDPARAPRLGRDYTVLPEPQPTFGQGGIEVAEVFAYSCGHCANLQPAINTWKPNLPSDVRFVYIPAAFGGVTDNFARAYFAAETMGLSDKTHDAMFHAYLVQQTFRTGSLEELADWYASQGADRGVFLSTMSSFAINAKVSRARQFALRTNVEATPTVIINGKYKATMTGDRGPPGLLDTIDWLVAKERAEKATP